MTTTCTQSLSMMHSQLQHAQRMRQPLAIITDSQSNSRSSTNSLNSSFVRQLQRDSNQNSNSKFVFSSPFKNSRNHRNNKFFFIASQPQNVCAETIVVFALSFLFFCACGYEFNLTSC